MLLDTFLIEGTTYWLGLSDLAHEGSRMIPCRGFMDHLVIFSGTYRWQESHQVAEYVNWAPTTEPNGGADHNCIWKTYQATHPGWHDADCSWSDYGHGYGQQHALCEAAK